MDSSKIKSLIEDLDDEIDDLEEALAPLLETKLSKITSKAPVMDTAKLCATVTYAIESMLFSYLRLHGVNAKEHPVFRELTRVKHYFQKISAAEIPVKPRDMSLDKGAATRFIKAGLAGNDKWDEQRANDLKAQRARANIKFDELSETMAQNELNKKRKAETDDLTELAASELDSDSGSDSPAPTKKVKIESLSQSPPEQKKRKKRKKNKKNALEVQKRSNEKRK